MSRASALYEPFESLPRQRSAVSFGMWIFLATEIVLFGGLFVAYAVYRFRWPEGFAAAAQHTDVVFGTVNTLILLTSSATMMVAVETARLGLKRIATGCLVATALFGIAFMVLKGFEYRADLAENLVPGRPGFPVSRAGGEIFFALYWIMTGLHAIHLSLGVAIVLATAALVATERIAAGREGTLHAVGLYWHLIDIIWIVLFPLLYLVGRAG